MSKLRNPAARRGGTAARRPVHLDALRELIEPTAPDPTLLFERGLKLLVNQLLVDRAVIVRITDLGYETLWWATMDGSDLDLGSYEPTQNFCPQVVEQAPRALVIRDTKRDHTLQGHPAVEASSVRAYIGIPLRRDDTVVGVLSVQSSLPRKFTQGDIVLVSMVASLLGSAMEIEMLKQELHQTREALDLTMSVVEDSALEAHDTRLPSRRYLDIWLKAYLFMARRRTEPLALVLWKVPLTRDSRKALREISDMARGEDLLVDMGKETFLMLLPRTSLEGAAVVVDRMRSRLGPIPMGTALWDPTVLEDHDDLAIRLALRRAHTALASSHGTLGTAPEA